MGAVSRGTARVGTPVPEQKVAATVVNQHRLSGFQVVIVSFTESAHWLTIRQHLHMDLVNVLYHVLGLWLYSLED